MQARDYCRKADGRIAGPWELGVFQQGGQGRRSDLSAAVVTLRERGLGAVADEHGESFVKYHKGLQALEDQLDIPLPDTTFQPRPWQQQLLNILQSSPDDRTILWVADPAGGSGKSRLARHLCLNHKAICLSGKTVDMAHMYRKQPIAIFDISRAAAEHSDHVYTMAEKLKDGILSSGKYEGTCKIFRPPHVIVFANFEPDAGKWTPDRVKLIRPQEDDPQQSRIALNERMRAERERSRSPVTARHTDSEEPEILGAFDPLGVPLL